MKITEKNQLKVGDVVTIEKEPSFWSCAANTNYPLNGKVQYPYTMTVKEIKRSSAGTIGFTEGKYGWSLSSCIEAGFVKQENTFNLAGLPKRCFCADILPNIGNLYKELQEEIDNLKEIKPKMKIFKTKTVKIEGKERVVTLAILLDSWGNVEAGYSVKAPEDKENPQLARKIAIGRAQNAKTNLFFNERNPMLGETFHNRYMLHAIAEHLFLQIERGEIERFNEIKGIK